MNYNNILPYTARVEEKVDKGKGSWNYLNIGIYHLDEKIGEYQRNYSSFYNTFHPFIGVDGKWYAIYSKDYTGTRIMSLPDCKDIGGEERDGCGFCPVDYFVPSAYKYEFESFRGDICKSWIVIESDFAEEELKSKFRDGEMKFAPYAFLCGCVWGNDSSWKIQFLDLSQAHRGILKSDDRFGYVEMARSCNRLIDAVQIIEWMEGDEPDWTNVRFTFDAISDCYKFNGNKLKLDGEF